MLSLTAIVVGKKGRDIPEADALYVGIAPPGGKLPAEWRPIILEALPVTLMLQANQGLPDGCSAHAQRLRQILFVDFLTRLNLPENDPFLKDIIDLISQVGASGKFFHQFFQLGTFP